MNKSKWESFNNRVRSAATNGVLRNNKDGLMIVSAHIVINHDGEPLLWVINDERRIEPTASASAILESIISD